MPRRVPRIPETALCPSVGARGRSPQAPRAARLALAGLLLAAALPAPASPQSDALVAEGAALMDRSRYAAALEVFEQAAKADPGDAQAFFFAGAALNRLGRSGESVERLERALFLSRVTGVSPAHPDLDFELGWALLQEGRHAAAAAALERYERAYPGRGQTAEFLGRAYLGLGRHAAAEAALAEALERDPALEPTVRLARASLAQRRGDFARADRELLAILDQPRSSVLGRFLERNLPRATGPAARPWGAVLSLGAGYNSSGVAIAGDEAVAAAAADRGDRFARLAASGYYTWRPADWVVAAWGSVQADRYDDLATLDQTDTLAALQATRRLGERLSLGAGVQDRYTRVDGGSFLNRVSVGPMAWYRLTNALALGLAYTLAKDDFNEVPAIPSFDRDSRSRRLEPKLDLNLADRGLRVQLGAAYASTDADGADFDNHSLGLTAQLDAEADWGGALRLYFLYERRRYDNLNTLTAFTFKRRDRTRYFQAHADYPLARLIDVPDELKVYLQYDYTERDSKIGFFDFDQEVVSAGISWEF